MTLLGIKLKQTQQLNQRLQQSLRVLQMSGIELEREVENWLSDNPLLERKDTDEFSDAEFSHYTAPARQIGGDEGEDMLSNIAGELDSIDGNRSQTLARIKKRLPQTDSGTLEAALDLIASLNPFPAAGFASSTPTPYSDEALANLLAFRGMEVSRRTIAKYRESFEIPAAHKRKTAE